MIFHHFQTQLKIGKCRLHSDCQEVKSRNERIWVRRVPRLLTAFKDDMFALLLSCRWAASGCLYWCAGCSSLLRSDVRIGNTALPVLNYRCVKSALDGVTFFTFFHKLWVSFRKSQRRVQRRGCRSCSNEGAHVQKLVLEKNWRKTTECFSPKQFVWTVVFLLLRRRCLESVRCWLSLLSLFLDAALWCVSPTVDLPLDLLVQVKPGCCWFVVNDNTVARSVCRSWAHRRVHHDA